MSPKALTSMPLGRTHPEKLVEERGTTRSTGARQPVTQKEHRSKATSHLIEHPTRCRQGGTGDDKEYRSTAT
eukprot:4297883-Amphidinium_carterae.1